MLLEIAKSAEPPNETDRVAEAAATVATEADGPDPRADHRRDLARTLVDNFGDTAAIVNGGVKMRHSGGAKLHH
ncbi:MAG: hypothetical protein QF893_21655 [Alphaproteobacteria bacterium]|nr:hypothetical protein [Alphaproteobacteria bacterium]